MGRYLLYFSYIGSSFSGSQQQVMAGTQLVRTVQGVIEKAFDHLKLIERGKLTLASRTDAGVHALANTLHFDAEYTKEDMRQVRAPDPKMFMFGLNSVLDRCNEPVRIWKAIRVAPDFNCRAHAISREYLYRLAVLNHNIGGIGFLAPLTAVEVNRCLVYSGDFDEKLFYAAADQFNGIHSFTNFTTAESIQDKGGNSIRSMEVHITRSKPLMSDHWPINVEQDLTFYDVSFRSNSFFYHQIRRMVGCLLQIAGKRVPLETLAQILKGDNAPIYGPHPTPTVAPCGLYLKKIEYKPEDLILPPNLVPSDDFPVNVLKSFTKRNLT